MRQSSRWEVLRNPSLLTCKKYLAQLFIALRAITRGYVGRYRTAARLWYRKGCNCACATGVTQGRSTSCGTYVARFNLVSGIKLRVLVLRLCFPFEWKTPVFGRLYADRYSELPYNMLKSFLSQVSARWKIDEFPYEHAK